MHGKPFLQPSRVEFWRAGISYSSVPSHHNNMEEKNDGTVVCAQECRLQMNSTTHMYVVSARGEGLIVRPGACPPIYDVPGIILRCISTTAENKIKRFGDGGEAFRT